MDRTATAHRSGVLAAVCANGRKPGASICSNCVRTWAWSRSGLAHYRQAVHATTELALQTDKGIVLATSVLDMLRHRYIILPTLDVIERVCAEAITRANRRIYEALSEPLSNDAPGWPRRFAETP
jgi:hypothetical protein